MGCAFSRRDSPVVEYLTWPIADEPGSREGRPTSMRSATYPMPFSTDTREPFHVTMPADSWPRCCMAYSPRYVRFAASAWPKMPKTPHSSRNLSEASPRGTAATTRVYRSARRARRPERQGCRGKRHVIPIEKRATEVTRDTCKRESIFLL